MLLHDLTHIERNLISKLILLKLRRRHRLLCGRLHQNLSSDELRKHLLRDRLLNKHLLLLLLLLLVERCCLENLLHELRRDVLEELLCV